MPGRFYLNTLVDEAKRRLRPPVSGTWVPEGAGDEFLKNYASDIKVPETIDNRDLLERVPSVFAWPIQFARAVEDAKHPLHRVVVGEWRGLLAAFALQDYLGLQIAVSDVSIPPRETTGEPRFVTILRNQLPRPAGDWLRWSLLYVNKQLVGATSPWSVVYTPADYQCPEGVLFQRDHRFVDPVEYFESARGLAELVQLHQWVGFVLAQYPWKMTKVAGHADGVKVALETWQQELEAAIDRLHVQGVSANADRQSWGFAATRVAVTQSPYACFLAPVVPEGGTAQDDSDLLLKCRPGKGQVLVLSERGLGAEVRVFQGVSGAAVDIAALPGPESGPGWKTKAGREIPYGYVVPEKVFFPEKLAVFAEIGEEVKVDSLATPLTPKFFEYFDYEEIGEIGRVVTLRLEANVAVVELRLPMQKGGVLRVERRYEVKTQDHFNLEHIELVDGGIAFAIWPNFYDLKWKDNFAAYNRSGDTVAVAPLTSSGQLLPRTLPEDHSVRIWESDAPPIGFALFKPGERWGSNADVSVGLILRPKLERAPDTIHGRSWRVAVDFGTSSSHLMVEAGGDVSPLVLRNRTQFLLDRLGQGLGIADSLFPATNAVPPFDTLLADSAATIRAPGRPSVSRIPWFSAPLLRVSAMGVGGVGRVFQDLKWRGGSGEGIPLRDYLTALVRLVLAEARAAGVGSVRFEWSFPLSLPKGSKDSMAGFWAALGLKFGQRQPVEVSASPSGIAESEAVCRFLSTRMGPAGLAILGEGLTVVVDVGGGSTDIGFWTGGRFLDQISMKLAGNDVLVPLCEVPDFVPKLCNLSLGAPMSAELEPVFREHPAIMVNRVLTEAMPSSVRYNPSEHPVATGLFSREDETAPPWKHARTAVHILFTGLGFLVGLLARRHLVAGRPVNVYLGGRGASLLTWIASLPDKRADIIKSAVTAGLSQESAQPPDIRVFGPVIAPHRELVLKDEVARGLLSPALEGANVTAIETTVLGERLFDNQPWHSQVTAAELRTMKLPAQLDHGYIGVYLIDVLPKSAAGLGLDDERIKKLTTVDVAVVEQLLKQDRTLLQPLFAYELTAVLAQYLRTIRSSGG